MSMYASLTLYTNDDSNRNKQKAVWILLRIGVETNNGHIQHPTHTNIDPSTGNMNMALLVNVLNIREEALSRLWHLDTCGTRAFSISLQSYTVCQKI